MRLRKRHRRTPTTQHAAAPPAWLDALLTEVWTSEGLPSSMLPRLVVSLPARSTRGYINYGRVPFRIVVRVHQDAELMRNTLLHEMAHAVHRTHAFERVTCTCNKACIWDGHGAIFKWHLARLEHRFQTGTHSRWGLAGCRGLRRVPARTPWHASISCPRQEVPFGVAEDLCADGAAGVVVDAQLE
jgi:hypothetical protein